MKIRVSRGNGEVTIGGVAGGRLMIRRLRRMTASWQDPPFPEVEGDEQGLPEAAQNPTRQPALFHAIS